MQRFGLRVFALWLTIMLALSPLVGATPTAQAQPPDDQLGESLGFVILFPQLRTLPPPAWFQPGVRVSYNSISANFQGGGAGGGVIQYDILGLEGGWAIASAQTLLDTGAGALVPAGASPKVGLPAVGEFWINPDVLAGAEAVQNPNLSVTRFNKAFMGQNFPIVRFQSQTSGGGRTVWEFDANGGLLMFYSTSLDGVSASQLEVINFRTLNLPTQGTRAPNWVRPGAQLEFSGTQSQSIPSAGTITSPYFIATQILGATPTWSVQVQNVFLNNSFAGSNTTATGIGQIFGGLWLPREAVDRIVPQAFIIDEDPVTGMQLSVGRTNNGEIFLREAIGQVYETVLFYNPVLGSLDGFLQTVASPTGTQRIDIRRTGGSDLAQLNSLPELPSEPSTPETPIQPDPATSQEFDIDLPTTVLTLVIPSDFVGEPVDANVNIVLGAPLPPTGATPVGDPFVFMVNSRATGDPVLTFDRPVTIRIRLPSLSPADTDATRANKGPALYYRAGSDWQRLSSVYDAANQTVTASHNRAGLYALFFEAEFRTFLPALQR